MQVKHLTVVARFRSKAGMEERLKRELLALIQLSRSDEGCINYDLHQAIDDPAVFVFHENWQSREHLDRHTATPHIRDFRSKAKELLAEPPELILLERIEP